MMFYHKDLDDIDDYYDDDLKEEDKDDNENEHIIDEGDDVGIAFNLKINDEDHGVAEAVICKTGFTLSRLIPRLCLPWSQVRD